jgi:hypothetical protein
MHYRSAFKLHVFKFKRVLSPTVGSKMIQLPALVAGNFAELNAP